MDPLLDELLDEGIPLKLAKQVVVRICEPQHTTQLEIAPKLGVLVDGSFERWTKGVDKKIAKGYRRRIIIILSRRAATIAINFVVQSAKEVKGVPVSFQPKSVEIF